MFGSMTPGLDRDVGDPAGLLIVCSAKRPRKRLQTQEQFGCPAPNSERSERFSFITTMSYHGSGDAAPCLSLHTEYHF